MLPGTCFCFPTPPQGMKNSSAKGSCTPRACTSRPGSKKSGRILCPKDPESFQSPYGHLPWIQPLLLLLGGSGSQEELFTRGCGWGQDSLAAYLCIWMKPLVVWGLSQDGKRKGVESWTRGQDGYPFSLHDCILELWRVQEYWIYQPWAFSLLRRHVCQSRRILHVLLNSLFTWYTINL